MLTCKQRSSTRYTLTPMRKEKYCKRYKVALSYSKTKLSGLFCGEVLVGAVGIEHDPLFLSPAIRWRCSRLPNSIADSAG
jgi:hypothetical protein